MNQENRQKGQPQVGSDDLLAADDTIDALLGIMAAEFQSGGNDWPRDWMQRHSDDRAILIKARAILIDRAEMAKGLPIAADHPEATCGDCGGPNVVWFAPSEIWNKACRPPGYDRDPMLCPRCFAVRAHRAGISCVWEFHPANVEGQAVLPGPVKSKQG